MNKGGGRGGVGRWALMPRCRLLHAWLAVVASCSGQLVRREGVEVGYRVLPPIPHSLLLAELTANGHALLEGALATQDLDAMAERMDADAAHAALDPERLIRDRGEGQPFGHIQLGLPRDETTRP